MATVEALRADITTLDVDAIVNAANRDLRPGGGVCGAIHAAAGPRLAEACRRVAPCPVGEARATDGFSLPARWVVHAVGPTWSGGAAGEARLLAACYRSALAVAEGLGASSIAFPAISTGIYGYPKDEAAEIAVATVRGHEGPIDRVVLVAFDDADLARYRRLLG